MKLAERWYLSLSPAQLSPVTKSTEYCAGNDIVVEYKFSSYSQPAQAGGAPNKPEPLRLRGRALMSLRKNFFFFFLLCKHCSEKTPPVIRPATELDHIVAIANGGEARPEMSGYQGLCSECHAEKSRKDLGMKEKARFENGRVIW